MAEDFLNEQIRAEDIILGSLGFGEDAHIISINRTEDGFSGKGRFTDGDEFEFANDDEPDPLQQWALSILLMKMGNT